MTRTDPHYQNYLQILQEELLPAMGCTEPIAVAYACAKARALLGKLPDRVTLLVSGNIIKNDFLRNTSTQRYHNILKHLTLCQEHFILFRKWHCISSGT